MRWQKALGWVISIFVVAFIGYLGYSMRRQAAIPDKTQKPAPEPPPEAKFYSPSPGVFQLFDDDRLVFELKPTKFTQLGEDRYLMTDGVELMTDRNGKKLTITAREADAKVKDGTQVESATFKQDVHLTTAAGLDVKAGEASYVESEGIVTIPGPVTFSKGRMSGSGVGATYDRNREVLWILEKAKINVAKGKDGAGALDGDAGSIGLARAEHYLRMITGARLTGDGRTMEADEITITMTEDDERIQMAQLRGNSRITGGGGGPQSMSAKDIDLMYAEDGRTLQNANLMENAVVQLPPSTGSGQAGAGRKRVAARVLNIGLAPDGSTVTHLQGTENVQVDLPAEPKVPAKRITAATLLATGAPESGLRSATFSGKVEYKETQPAGRGSAAVERTATSDSLVIDTKAGLGAIEKADFRGHVDFREAPELHGEGPQAIYDITKDRLEILPGEYPGKVPRVSDGKISVTARTIALTLASRDLSADTKVRSTILAKQNRGRGQQARVPSVLKDDEPVNVTANRLQYSGATSKATYSGNVTLWQDSKEADDANMKGDTLVIDDKTGNLELIGNATTPATTDFMLEETDQKTGKKKKTRTTGKADNFLYEDERRLATYTGNAQLDGAQGNLKAARIQVTLKQEVNEVERLEAWAQGGVVVLTESQREVRGTHLTYTAADDTYLMVGTPVIVVEQEKGACREARGGTLTLVRGAGTRQWKLEGRPDVLGDSKEVPCPASVKK